MPSNASDFTASILQWYAYHQRDLPWRKTNNPYLIWLSEVILQQTRIEQGLPYYYKFSEHYPTVEKLAQASEQEVLNLWQGLGYYSRGRNLHAAAKQIVEKYNSIFPDSYAEIRRLPGVGDYTAAAISSFAFGLPHAVLDGNVFRLLSRHFGIEEEINTSTGKKTFSALAEELLDKDQPALYNQAIMDVGSVVCKPKSPTCALCPVHQSCVALRRNRIDSLPRKKPKKAKRNRYFYFFLLENAKGEVVIQKRNGPGIWQGLTHPILLETDVPKEIAEMPSLWHNQIKSLTGVETKSVPQFKSKLTHLLSHQRLFCELWYLSVKEFPILKNEHIFAIPLEEWVKDFPIPRAVDKLLHE